MSVGRLASVHVYQTTWRFHWQPLIGIVDYKSLVMLNGFAWFVPSLQDCVVLCVSFLRKSRCFRVQRDAGDCLYGLL